jgi:hypothetical protein
MLSVKYMVDPDELKENVFVPHAVRVKFIDLEGLKKAGFLGVTGLQLAEIGLTFHLTPDLVNELVEKGVSMKIISKI